MKIYPLSKKIIIFRNNAVEFLSGLSANSMDKAQNAFTDVHGRLIAVFDQSVISEEEVWAVIDEYTLNSVLAHLERYAQLSGVKTEKRDDLRVYFDLDGTAPAEGSIPQKKGRLIWTKQELKPNVSDQEFTLFRLRNNIPLQGIDFQQGEFLLNISETDHVSYNKGCFLGQEPIAKVHNRSKPSWKLIVKYEDECSAEEKLKMTSKTAEPASKRILGFVFVSNQK